MIKLGTHQKQLNKLTKSIFLRCKAAFGTESAAVTATPGNAVPPCPNNSAAQLIDFHGKWPDSEKKDFLRDMRVVPNFISVEEESKLFEEIEPYMKRLRYEYDHWDDAIHGFRETERKQWYPHNRIVLERVRALAFDGAIMPYIHILDLAELGVIKPHVDSTRYCGNTIAGLSLLSDSVMRLVRTDGDKFKQQPQQSADKEEELKKAPSESNYRDQVTSSIENNFSANLLLQRRSLYIMSDTARYAFTHEILANEFSKFNGVPIQKSRRISIICRNEPQAQAE